MSPAHVVNLSIHIAAGTIALGIGFAILFMAKGTPSHRSFGRFFCYMTAIVCVSAATGLVFFRFLPPFAMLTILVFYQLVGGWHVALTKSEGPSKFDAAWTFSGAAMTIAIAPFVLEKTIGSQTIVYSALGAIGTVLFYDTAKWFFPRRWHRSLWRYEHSYKMIAPLFGMLSALVGNVVRAWQPWSQLLPTILGVLVTLFFFFQIYRQDARLPQERRNL